MARYSNRREYTRNRLSRPVRVGRKDSDELMDAVLIDLGDGGLCLETSTPIKTGEEIYVLVVDLYPPGEGFWANGSFTGRVRWSRDMGCRDRTCFSIGVAYMHPTWTDAADESRNAGTGAAT